MEKETGEDHGCHQQLSKENVMKLDIALDDHGHFFASLLVVVASFSVAVRMGTGSSRARL